ncbi:cation-translocating P-type ATPase [Lactiplantibacillus mudanjiangensis]|uniref:ATPase P [Lactobacillus mucosae LM1] n=1 Tax=Lactiplantibacillus mudanjiangensis TaxID=1296538 RepID=A0A660DZP4_9LACO|nr:cation-translocating P-type ATPase [Lactiplantibacillus mudanjiangensis]VDG25472.1 ATPase P [Lactobacillus mucosae LM1] [Lactiplantibacillus mudanjiangensis]VDG28564.1 ATPase P [Lactobacillus mucosae LM1] [Lactiplantibacillus mudanjiangensis]
MSVNTNAEQVNRSRGLTTAEVNERIARQQTNQIHDVNVKTTWQIISSNTFTFFNLIFLVLAMLLVLVQSYKDLTFLPVIILNTVISIVQEIRSKRILNKLTVLNAEESLVERDGQLTEIKTTDLVLDDVVVFETGDQIPADAEVISGTLQVNEALLTGEADEITKNVDDSLMSGSFVVTGKAMARLTQVGDDSYISKLTAKAKSVGHGEESAMLKSLNRLIKIVGIILIPLGLALFAQSYFLNANSLKTSIVTMEAAVIGMIPEGLYLLTTVALALSATRLAKRQVLLHSLKSIETLARVSVLCVDKTGTITENEMAVAKVIKAQQNPQTEQELTTLLTNFSHSMASDNSTMQALQTYFKQPAQATASQTLPFGSAWKFSSATFNGVSYVLGAPEMVLRTTFKDYVDEFKQYTEQGYRVLVIGDYQAGELTEAKLVAPVLPLGFVLIENPIRKSAPATFSYFARQGVSVKVISGDNPQTVASVAQTAQIADADRYVDASTLAPVDYSAALQKYTVFGRVTPEQKQLFVTALQQQGETVAMTGDGVNDILAMKQADCSIAMASGNDATMHAAQMVLLDSDFSRMPKIVAEGRQVVNNIERSASLFLVKNIFSLTMAVLTLLFAFNYPLTPAHITLISLFTIGVPSFLLALEPNEAPISGNFLTNILRRATPGGLTDMIAVAAIVICGSLFGLSTTDIGTATVLIMSAIGFLVLYRMSRPLNQFRRHIMLGCIVGIIVTTLCFGNMFGIKTISMVALGFAVVLFLTADSILTHVTFWTNHWFKKLSLRFDK